MQSKKKLASKFEVPMTKSVQMILGAIQFLAVVELVFQIFFFLDSGNSLSEHSIKLLNLPPGRLDLEIESKPKLPRETIRIFFFKRPAQD